MNAQPDKVTAGSKSCAFKQTIVNQLIINHAFIDTNELFSRGGPRDNQSVCLYNQTITIESLSCKMYQGKNIKPASQHFQFVVLSHDFCSRSMSDTVSSASYLVSV